MRSTSTQSKFHRLANRRRSFIRELMNNLVRYEKIETTEARAKAIRPRVEKAITLGKKQTIASRRILISRLHDKRVANKIMTDLAVRYKDRNGGYLRITKLSVSRKRDGADLARIEFV